MVVGKVKFEEEGQQDTSDESPAEGGGDSQVKQPVFAPLPARTTDADFPRVDYYLANDRHPPVPSIFFERGTTDLSDLTVQASVFTSREFYDLEVEKLWTRVWQVACRENDIPNVGDFYEYEIVGRSILIVRTAPDTVKAFYNTCRHRGAAVAAGCGNATEFSCPFHGWTYGLDGALKHIPAAWDFPHVDMAESGLRECPVGTWNGWVFINMDPDAQPLRDFIGEVLTRHFDHPWMNSGRMVKLWHIGLVAECNWKVMVAAFVEFYHVRRTHPQLVATGTDMQGQTDIWGLHGRLLGYNATPSIGLEDLFSEQDIADTTLSLAGVAPGTYVVPEGVPARHVVADALKELASQVGIDLSGASDAEMLCLSQYHIFPNFLTFAGRPGHPVFRVRPHGDDPNKCLFELMFLAEMPPGMDLPPDAPMHMCQPGESFIDHQNQIGFFGIAIDQDMSNGPKIQRGLRGLDKMVFGRTLEPLIVGFHRNLETWLGITAAEKFRHS